MLVLVVAGAVLVALLIRQDNQPCRQYLWPDALENRGAPGYADIRLFDAQADLNDIYIGNPQVLHFPNCFRADGAYWFERFPAGDPCH